MYRLASIRRPLLAAVLALPATLLALVLPAGGARAASTRCHTRPARIAVHRSRTHRGAGTVTFSLPRLGQPVREVVILIDGRRRRTFRHRRARYGTPVSLRRLLSGRHVLAARVRLGRGGRVLTFREVLASGHLLVAGCVVRSSDPGARSTRSGPPQHPYPPVSRPPQGPQITGPVALFNRNTYSFSTRLSMSQEASRYQIVVLQSTNGSVVAQLHAANPNVRVLMYMDPMDSSPADPTALTQCTAYPTDLSSQPGWFLKDQNGQPLLYDGNRQNHIMDVGDPSYQQACVARAIALAKGYGFDGIFWDDIETQFRWVFPAGLYSQKYPTPSAYYQSFLSFVSYAGPAARAQGLLTVGNIAAATTAQWQQLNTPMDGAEEESWTDGGFGAAQQLPFFATKLANAAWSEAHDKYAILHSYNLTEAGNTYGLASMLLVAAGHCSYATSQGNYTTSEYWYPEYTTAEQLGEPTAAYTELSNGTYARAFQHGTVVVNPTTATQTVRLRTTTVTLPPTSGSILLGTF